jgi:hypothetical protein
MGGPIDNTVNNGVISSALLTNMAATINELYDFCTDLGLNQSNTVKKGLWRRHTGTTTLRTYGAEETRFFSGRYSKSVNASGLLHTFDVNFAGAFAMQPEVTATVQVNASKGYAFACVSNVLKDTCKVHVYSPSSTKYTGDIIVHVLAIGVEASGI